MDCAPQILGIPVVLFQSYCMISYVSFVLYMETLQTVFAQREGVRGYDDSGVHKPWITNPTCASGFRTPLSAPTLACNNNKQLSKATPSLEQIRVILEACLYRGKEEEASADRGRLEMCTLGELQVSWWRRVFGFVFCCATGELKEMATLAAVRVPMILLVSYFIDMT